MFENLERSSSFTAAIKRLGTKSLSVGSIISVGAGSGGDSVHLLNQFPRAKILLIEMDERFRSDLEKHAASDDRVSFAICGAASEDGEGRFKKTTAFGGVISSAADGVLPNDEGTVAFRSVDSLVSEYSLPPPYLLKFDTHGAEMEIISGASKTFEETNLIFMEMYNFQLNFVGGRNLRFDEMTGYLRSRGLVCIDIFDLLFRPGDFTLWQFQAFFIRDDHPTLKRSGYSSWKQK